MKKVKNKNKATVELICGKCEDLLPERFYSGGKLRLVTERPSLIIADPPDNYGVEYDKHDDHQPFDDYMKWTHLWLNAACDVLDKHGTLFLFYPDELVSEVDMYCKHHLGLYKRAQIIWYFTFGVCNSSGKNFSRSHAHILYYV